MREALIPYYESGDPVFLVCERGVGPRKDVIRCVRDLFTGGLLSDHLVIREKDWSFIPRNTLGVHYILWGYVYEYKRVHGDGEIDYSIRRPELLGKVLTVRYKRSDTYKEIYYNRETVFWKVARFSHDLPDYTEVWKGYKIVNETDKELELYYEDKDSHLTLYESFDYAIELFREKGKAIRDEELNKKKNNKGE